MGFGDVKLAALMGLYVGWLGTTTLDAVVLVLWAMLIGFVAGSVIGVVLLVARRRNRPFPFGPVPGARHGGRHRAQHRASSPAEPGGGPLGAPSAAR